MSGFSVLFQLMVPLRGVKKLSLVVEIIWFPWEALDYVALALDFLHKIAAWEGGETAELRSFHSAEPIKYYKCLVSVSRSN